MRFSEAWLRQYVNPIAVSTADLVHKLTMAGLEVDSVSPAAAAFSGVVVGEIIEAEPHPEADRLRVCRVDVGTAELLQIVCGAPNARPGLRAPLATEGAVLPGGLQIRASKLRGIQSFGMLCSARELGIDEDASGLMELPDDAPAGTDIRAYLQLDDSVIELGLTPNRADCLSVEGIAREVALLFDASLSATEVKAPNVSHDLSVPVTIDAPDACPRYLGRLIKGIRQNAPTPIWMKERLRRSGIRSLDLIVDVTNYVLIELGQPLHAFDASKLEQGVRVRYARDGESLHLLNGQEVTLDSASLVIADEVKPLALAGIMGGMASAVTVDTCNVQLESAFFTPELIMGKARRYGLTTDSSHRFERGVSFELQRRALDRASELITRFAGGQAGPIVEASSHEHLPVRNPILLRRDRIQRVLGLEIESERVLAILTGLGMQAKTTAQGWSVTAPAYRFDISIEADLIEEIGRIFGYENLPRRSPTVAAVMPMVSECQLKLDRVKDLLVDRGYQEAITYSFIDPVLQARINPDINPLPLKNPISAEMAVMRTSIWPGLLDAAIKNNNRQQQRVRIFESGLKFVPVGKELRQEKALAWLGMGSVYSEQWGQSSREIDFFDIKADIEAIIALTGRLSQLSFESGEHPALHPGQSARISLGPEPLGWVGMLHPKLGKELGFDQRVFLVELDQSVLMGRDIPKFAALSKFPSVRRDIAVIAKRDIPNSSLIACVSETPQLDGILREVIVFDIYQDDKGIGEDLQSVALGLLLQDGEQTLIDGRVDEAVAAVIQRLANEFNAVLRD